MAGAVASPELTLLTVSCQVDMRTEVSRVVARGITLNSTMQPGGLDGNVVNKTFLTFEGQGFDVLRSS